jgi:hypothetical protein
MEVPLPSRSEQDEVVRKIEASFSKIDLLAAEAEKALDCHSRNRRQRQANSELSIEKPVWPTHLINTMRSSRI